MDEQKGNGSSAGGGEIEQEAPLQHQEVSSSTTTSMKFSFSASKLKFSASRPPQFPIVGGKRRGGDGAGGGRQDKEVEFVTGFDEQGLVGKDPKGLRGARVIPKLEDKWRPEKRMKNIVMETNILTSSQEERFERDETVVGGPTSAVQYGLTESFKKVMETSKSVTTELNGNNVVQERTIASRLRGTAKQKSIAQNVEDERFRQVLTTLPDVVDMDVYEDMPVEDFAEAMLRGMGWEKGNPIGRRSKVAVVPVEYVRRSGRTGLGATPAPKEVNNTRQIRSGESRVPAPELVASVGPDGKVRHVVTVDEKLVERSRKGVVNGKVMSIISGRHLGLRGAVLESDKSDRVLMKLVKSGEKIVVSSTDLADIGSLEEEKVLKQIRQLKIGNGETSQLDYRKDDSNLYTEGRKEDNRHGRKDDKRDLRRSSARDQRKEESRDEGRRRERKRDERREDHMRTQQDRDERGGERERRRSYNEKDYDKMRRESSGSLRDGIGISDEGRYKDSWLTSQIRVRIISKTLKGGRFYLKKGRIVDVVTPTECDLLLDESGEILQQVKQDQLETALPKRGGRIMVVGGKFRGHLGKLIERDSEREVGHIQMEENFEMRTLDLNIVAEFVGEASERDD